MSANVLNMEKKPETLGLEIQRLRLKAGVTLRKFAVQLGVSAAHLSDIEHDKRRPSKDLLERIAQKLKSVGASLEALDQLTTKLEPDLQRWMSETPMARQLLRQVYESKGNSREVLRELEKHLKDKGGKK